MLSRAELKLLQGLQRKKQRTESGLFLAEGEKIVEELLDHGYPVKKIFATSEWTGSSSGKAEVIMINDEELKKISSLSTPNKVVALCEQRKSIEPGYGDWIFCLEQVQDPGNLGTIIRIADWFGIKDIVCSNDSVDLYNPKVIQSTMGSFINVNVYYTDIEKYLHSSKRQTALYGTSLDGEPISDSELNPGIIVFGNESVGISDKTKAILDKRILIPSAGKPVADSLNVAVTAAIVAAFVKRA